MKFERLDYLDSVRGIAALMVVVYHFIGWKWASYTKYHVASLLFNGSDAVSFFFVLSGFVLSYKYFRTKAELDVPYYFFKRVLRLYPAFIVAVLINYLYWNRGIILDGNFVGLLKDMFVTNDQQLWQELIMIRNQHKFYIPGWTLGVEMALSLAMPLFIYAARSNIKVIWSFLPISILLGNYMSMFSFHFTLGVLLSYYFPLIQQTDFKNTKWFRWRYLLVALTFIFFSIRHLNKILPFGKIYDQFTSFWKIDFFHFTGLASAIILVIIINSSAAQKFLVKPIWLFLGKISYSLYLMHWIVIVYIMDHWDSLLSLFPNFYIAFACLLLTAIFLTILLAFLLYYFVEKPFIALSKRSKLFTST